MCSYETGKAFTLTTSRVWPEEGTEFKFIHDAFHGFPIEGVSLNISLIITLVHQ